MKTIQFLILLILSVITIVLCLKTMSDDFSISSLAFIAWGLVPWLYIAIITGVTTHKPKLISLFVVTAIVGALGIGVLIDTLYIHLDPQGGLIFIFLPLWQLLFFILASPFLLLFKKHQALGE